MFANLLQFRQMKKALIQRRQFVPYVVFFFGLILCLFGNVCRVMAQQPPEPVVPVAAPSPTGELEIDSPAATDQEKIDASVPTKEVPAAVEASKVDISDSAEAQDELYSQEKLPFRYLNQYFTYDVKDGVVSLNEKAFLLNNIQLTMDSKKNRIHHER